MLLVVAACGGSDDGAATTVPVTTIATTSAAPATTTAPVATVPVTAVPLEVSVVGTDITYAPDRALDVLAPAVGGPWPVVVVAPGFGQGKSDMKVLAEAVAAEGAVVYNASVEYSRDGAVMPDSIEALACAIRYARATAADYGGDPGWITLVGNSAGAASGAVVALDGDAYPRDGCVESESSAVVNGFVGCRGLKVGLLRKA